MRNIDIIKTIARSEAKPLAKKARVDNYVTGTITSQTTTGKFVISTEGGATLRAFDVSGQNVGVGDRVSVRLIDGNINKAEIASRTSRRIPNEITEVWR